MNNINTEPVTPVKEEKPIGWWMQLKGHHIKDFDHFKDLMMGGKAEYKSSQVFLFFFMEHCPWCEKFLGQWNALNDEMHRLYGKEKIQFLIINKELREISSKYHASRFPSIYYVKPDNNAKKGQKFEDQRNYENVLDWMRMKCRMHGAKLIVDEEEEEDV